MEYFLRFSIFACIFNLYICDPSYFDCYKDRCERGVQHCVHAENEWRCFHCQDMAKLCGSSKMPRDCDSFCVGIELQQVQERLKASLEEKKKIFEDNKKLNASHDITAKELMELKDKNRQLILENDENIEKIKLYENFQQNYTDLEGKSIQMTKKFKECSKKSDVLIKCVVLTVAVSVIVILGVVLYFKPPCKRNKKRRQREKTPGKNQYLQEETKIMIPNSTDESSNTFKRTDSKDSAVNLSGDSSSTHTNESSDIEVDGQTRKGAKVKKIQDSSVGKEVPDALKGIPPTSTPSSQIGADQKIYS